MGVRVERQIDWEMTDQNGLYCRFILSLEDGIWAGHAHVGDTHAYFPNIPAEDVHAFFLALAPLIEG